MTADRAAILTTAVLQVIAQVRDPAARRFCVEALLRDEIADIKREVAAEREIPDA